MPILQPAHLLTCSTVSTGCSALLAAGGAGGADPSPSYALLAAPGACAAAAPAAALPLSARCSCCTRSASSCCRKASCGRAWGSDHSANHAVPMPIRGVVSPECRRRAGTGLPGAEHEQAACEPRSGLTVPAVS